MATKCEKFIKKSKNFIDICKTQIWLSNRECYRDHRCEGTNMVYKCKIFEAAYLPFNGMSILYIYMSVLSAMFMNTDEN